MYELIGMYYSPWTERSRWAVDYHKLPYRYTEYTTMLGEPGLRLKTGKLLGKVSVPLLITPGKNVSDSFQIAKFTDSVSGEKPLVPPELDDRIRQWVDSAELALCSARIRATRRIKKSPEALADRLPAYIPGFLRQALVPMAFLGAEFILYKYNLEDTGDESLFNNMLTFYEKAGQALKGREFVFDEFSFADIVVATAMQAVTPVAKKYIDLSDASIQCMNEPELAEKYSFLVEWRDRIYAKYR